MDIPEFLTNLESLNKIQPSKLLDKDMIYIYIKDSLGMLYDPITLLASYTSHTIYPLERVWEAGEYLGISPGDLESLIHTIDGIKGKEDELYIKIKSIFQNETALSNLI